MTMTRMTRFWMSTVVMVLVWWRPAVIGSDTVGSAKCPADVRGETRRCLVDYTGQLDALLQSDNRFFPGLDVEVIRSLCSLLEDSKRCISAIVANCRENEKQPMEEELIPHMGVKLLCIHPNIYEEYALNQNCFVRIRPEAENCNRIFMIAVQDDEPIERQPSASSSSSLSSSQRHQSPQQRQYCNNVKRLITCVKGFVRSSTTSCQKMALKLVDVLVRASLPTIVSCRDEPNSSATPVQGKSPERSSDDEKSSGNSLHGSSGPLKFWCFVLASLVCLRSLYQQVVEPSASLLFHRRPSPTTPLPPPPRHRRRHLHHHRFPDLLLS